MSLLPDRARSSYQFRNDHLQSVFVGCFLNGTFVVAVCLTLYASVTRKGWDSLLRPMIGSMLFMYGLATINLAVHWDLVRFAFINHGQTEDTIFATLVKRGSPRTIGLGNITFYINMAVAHGVLIWRCWVIWNRNWKIVPLPLLLVIAEFASGIANTAIALSTSTQTSRALSVSLTNSAIALASTLVITALIISRVFKAGGSKFRAIGDVVVESGMLYSLAIIFYLAFSITPRFTNIIPGMVLSQVTGLAPTLMMARSTFGLARPDSSWSKPTSTVRFDTRTRSRAAGQSFHAEVNQIKSLKVDEENVALGEK